MELQQQYLSLAYIVLPPSMLDWFDVVDVKMEWLTRKSPWIES